MAADPDPKPHERFNTDPQRDSGTGETVRPGERRPPGTMP
jgi:hypothetical protein